MPDAVVQGLATLTRVLEIAGAGALVLGFALGARAASSIVILLSSH